MDRSWTIPLVLVGLTLACTVTGWTTEVALPLVRAACVTLLVVALAGVVVAKGWTTRLGMLAVVVIAVGALVATRGGETGESGEFSAAIVQFVVGPLAFVPSFVVLLWVVTPDRRSHRDVGGS